MQCEFNLLVQSVKQETRDVCDARVTAMICDLAVYSFEKSVLMCDLRDLKRKSDCGYVRERIVEIQRCVSMLKSEIRDAGYVLEDGLWKFVDAVDVDKRMRSLFSEFN